MDQPDIGELLKSWGLPHLCQVVEDGRFDWETLQNLNPSTVACVTAYPGEQCKLLQKIADYKQKNVAVEDVVRPSLSPVHESIASTSRVGTSAGPSTSTSRANTSAGPSTSASCLSSDSTNSAPSSSRKRPSSSAGTSGTAKRVIATIDSVQAFEKFDLRKALENDDQCKHILLAYQSDLDKYNEEEEGLPPYLSNFKRNKITAVIGKFIRSVTIYPDHKLYPIFTKKILELFPFEDEETYYLKPYSKGAKQSQVLGKIHSFIKNARNTAAALGSSRSTSENCRNKNISTSRSNLTVVANKPITDEVKAAVAWLKLGRSPWPVVISKWVVTAPLRFRQLFKHEDETYVNNYLSEWPVLECKSGHELILEDFKLLYPSSTESLFSKWDMFVKRTINIAKNDIKDKQAKALLKNFSPGLAQNQDALTVLKLLPAIRPNHTVEIKKGEESVREKISIERARDSFLLVVTNAGDIKESIATRRASLVSGGVPLIVVVDQGKHQTAYVSVAKLLYKVESTLHALDLCFKSFHAFHITYSPESNHIWIMLQRALYSFTTEWDTDIQSSWIQAYA